MGDWQENSWNSYSQGEWSNTQVGEDLLVHVPHCIGQLALSTLVPVLLFFRTKLLTFFVS
jgi:hypothetical protein